MTVTIRKHRSPAYPAINLAEAIERARAFYKKEGKHAATLSTAAAHWGYSPTSSSRLATAAALKSFGLMTDKDGEGDQRLLQLSPLGLAIIQDERKVSPERDSAVREAALAPKIISDLWQKYGNELPSNETLAYHLTVERGFNPNAVNDVIRIYKESVAFAGLSALSSPAERSEDANEAPPNTAFTGPAERLDSKVSKTTEQRGEEIANIRVSRDCTIRLLATGPYSRKSIESLVAQLELGLKLGSYDELAKKGDVLDV